MSTICKLDYSVRLDRHLRKKQIRDLSKDIVKAKALLTRGEKALAEERHKPLPNHANITAYEQQLKQVITHLILAEMTWKHLRKLSKDPTRTGYAKDAILAKLGTP